MLDASGPQYLSTLRTLFTRPAVVPGIGGGAAAAGALDAAPVNDVDLVRLGSAIFKETVLTQAADGQFKSLGALLPPASQAGMVGGMLTVLGYGSAGPGVSHGAALPPSPRVSFSPRARRTRTSRLPTTIASSLSS